ncbi:MAG: hypothetical protein IT539_00605 [Bradyrhizobiaceae bacterium]|nr:hypothetical protein [Bradyrhizobiaceae bacterium]
MTKRSRSKIDEAPAAPAVRWFQATRRSSVVVLALLTDEGPSAYALSPMNANLLSDQLREAAAAPTADS